MMDILGLSVKDLVKKMGKPSRIERSEYGFCWYVYAGDYRKYLLAGVAGTTVVAAYSNSKHLAYKGIRFGTSKGAVRAILGEPIQSIRKENRRYILNKADQRDYFKAGSRFVIVFYDIVMHTGVTAVLIVPKEKEAQALLHRPAFTGGMVAACRRIGADLVNAARARSGQPVLLADRSLTWLAVSRSEDMRGRGYFCHYTPEGLSPFDQARRAGIRFEWLGENIAYGSHNCIFAHESFMNSQGHRDNILKAPYKRIGCGAAIGGQRHIILAQEFAG